MKIGISRFPSYYDMFYIETDAPITIIESYLKKHKNNPNRELEKFVNHLNENGFKTKVVNIDYVIDEHSFSITKTDNSETI